MNSPYPVVSVREMRALESAAIASGIPESLLQERAGRAVAEELAARVPRLDARVVALAGRGNNGRDAVVAARYLKEWGHPTRIWLAPRHSVTETEMAALGRAGIEWSILDADALDSRLADSLSRSDAVIDGLLGIGARGSMRSDLAAIVDLLSSARSDHPGVLVVAVDVPSGIDADEGAVLGSAVRADVTVTFGAIKAGLLRFPAASLAGTIVPRSIGLTAESLAAHSVLLLDSDAASALIPERPLDSHKYRFGRVLVVAGSDQFVGAACLAAGAAARAGCGLVSVASTAAVRSALAVRLPEAIHPLSPLDIEADPLHAARLVGKALRDHQALVLGPGLGRSDAMGRFVSTLLEENAQQSPPVPAVVDADGLNSLAEWEGWPEAIGVNNVLTPHAGEMARLMPTTGGSDLSPWDQAVAAAKRWRQVVVLKGPFSVVASPDGRAWVYGRANPALATAGTGDVLAGLCGGLLAQGLAPLESAMVGVVTHAIAGQRLVETRHWRTILASDMLEQIPSVLLDLQRRAKPGPPFL